MSPATASSRRKIRNTASPEAQEEAILSVAADEFAEVGVRRASVDEVAKRAGVSRSTLYRRFPNKEALLIGVASDFYEKTMRKLEAAVVGLGPREAIVEAFTVGAQIMHDDPLARRLVFTDHEMRGITSSMPAMFISVVTDRVATTLRKAGAEMPAEELLEVVEIHVRLVISMLEVPGDDEVRRQPSHVRAMVSKHLAPMIW